MPVNTRRTRNNLFQSEDQKVEETHRCGTMSESIHEEMQFSLDDGSIESSNFQVLKILQYNQQHEHLIRQTSMAILFEMKYFEVVDSKPNVSASRSWASNALLSDAAQSAIMSQLYRFRAVSLKEMGCYYEALLDYGMSLKFWENCRYLMTDGRLGRPCACLKADVKLSQQSIKAQNAELFKRFFDDLDSIENVRENVVYEIAKCALILRKFDLVIDIVINDSPQITFDKISREPLSAIVSKHASIDFEGLEKIPIRLLSLVMDALCNMGDLDNVKHISKIIEQNNHTHVPFTHKVVWDDFVFQNFTLNTVEDILAKINFQKSESSNESVQQHLSRSIANLETFLDDQEERMQLNYFQIWILRGALFQNAWHDANMDAAQEIWSSHLLKTVQDAFEYPWDGENGASSQEINFQAIIHSCIRIDFLMGTFGFPDMFRSSSPPNNTLKLFKDFGSKVDIPYLLCRKKDLKGLSSLIELLRIIGSRLKVGKSMEILYDLPLIITLSYFGIAIGNTTMVLECPKQYQEQAKKLITVAQRMVMEESRDIYSFYNYQADRVLILNSLWYLRAADISHEVGGPEEMMLRDEKQLNFNNAYAILSKLYEDRKDWIVMEGLIEASTGVNDRRKALEVSKDCMKKYRHSTHLLTTVGKVLLKFKIFEKASCYYIHHTSSNNLGKDRIH